MKTRFDISSNT